MRYLILTLATMSLGLGIAKTTSAPTPVLLQLPNTDSPVLLGGTSTSDWQTSAQMAQLLKKQPNKASMRRLSFSKLIGKLAGKTSLISLQEPETPCDELYGAKVSPSSSNKAGEFWLYTANQLTAQPRKVEVLPNNNSNYLAIVKQELAKRGITKNPPHIKRLIRSDLDGDGSNEVIIEARYFAKSGGLGADFPPVAGQPQDYSLLLLRHIKDGKVETKVLGEYVGPKKAWDPNSDESMPMASHYSLAGVADLNGDGKMELIIYGAYYEGYSVEVKTWTLQQGSKKTPLGTWCGV